jgi:hypothetical protein
MLDGADAMISDIISQTVVDLDRYLTDPNFDRTYTGEVRQRVIRLRDEADSLCAVLDMPPAEISVANDHTHQTDPERSKLIAAMMSVDDPALELRAPCFSQSDLLKRGWSMRLIAQLLGGRDWEVPNPHGVGFAPMLCWRKDRVFVAEDTPEFKEHSSRKSRSRGAQQ